MTKELLDRANALDKKLQQAEYELKCTGEYAYEVTIRINGKHWGIKDILGMDMENDLHVQIRRALTEKRDKLQAEFDALGNGGDDK